MPASLGEQTWVRTTRRTHGADPASVEINDASAGFFRGARHARDLSETGGYRRHCACVVQHIDNARANSTSRLCNQTSPNLEMTPKALISPVRPCYPLRQPWLEAQVRTPPAPFPALKAHLFSFVGKFKTKRGGGRNFR